MDGVPRWVLTAGAVAAAILVATTWCAPTEPPTDGPGGTAQTGTVTASPQDSAAPQGTASPTDTAPPQDTGSPSGDPSPRTDRDDDNDDDDVVGNSSWSGPGSTPVPWDEINALNPDEDGPGTPTFPETDEVHVVGVPQGSGLNIRLKPGIGRGDDVLGSAGPLDTLPLTGREGYFVDEGGAWVETVTQAQGGGELYGWVSLGYVATLGPGADVTDGTAAVAPGADPERLVLQVADARAPMDEPGPEGHGQGTRRTIVHSPRGGAGEWTVDLTGGYRDADAVPADRTLGERLTVRVQSEDGRFEVVSVESTPLCTGEFDADGACR